MRPASAEPPPLIRLTGLSKVFRTDELETLAVADVHLEIPRGHYVCIAGPSGSGKTTLLSLLGLLDTASAGTYLLDGETVTGLSASARARTRCERIGFVFQSFNLIGDLTVSENVELPLTYRAMRTAERRRRVAAALERVGMSHRARHLPSQLSGGQQQRVAIARSLMNDPLFLLADEATGNLDSNTEMEILTLLDELQAEGKTIVLVTHNEEIADRGDRTIWLADGRVDRIEEQVA